MSFVRSQRMDRVREELKQGESSVTAAALAWGFNHLGRFPSAYAARFGELPSETVQRARRHRNYERTEQRVEDRLSA
jgi:AraC-like DNA-binding protein